NDTELIGSIYIDNSFLINDNINDFHIEPEKPESSYNINKVDNLETDESLQAELVVSNKSSLLLIKCIVSNKDL
ncbi:9369_t:CDS:2, partial [Dentiscutata erythropus]